jgi:hypothetical protein
LKSVAFLAGDQSQGNPRRHIWLSVPDGMTTDRTLFAETTHDLGGIEILEQERTVPEHIFVARLYGLEECEITCVFENECFECRIFDKRVRNGPSQERL